MENKKLSTILTVSAFAITVIGLILCVIIMLGNESVVGPTINFTLALLAVAAGTALVFGVVQFLGNIKKNMPTLIAVVAFIVVAFICYSLASDEVLRTYDKTITPSASKFSETGLMIMYLLLILAVAVALVGEVGKLFK